MLIVIKKTRNSLKIKRIYPTFAVKRAINK